jgi:uncharacterized protein (DUF1697 family)
MVRYVAFLRGINVGGKSVIKMETLKASFKMYGFKNVKTFIQSGNILFDSTSSNISSIEKKIEKFLLEEYKSEIKVIVRSAAEIKDIVEHNPFQKVKVDKRIKFYVCFCAKRPKARLPVISEKEACEIIGIENKEIFILSKQMKNGRFGFPNNFIENELGTVSTTRNWNTVCKMVI